MRSTPAIFLLVVCAVTLAVPAAEKPVPSRVPLGLIGGASAAGKVDVSELGVPYFRAFDERNGLPQSSISSIAVDAKGYLWVATQDGAAYYNGRIWTPVHMPNRAASNYVDGVAAAPDGSMWFCSEGGGVLRLSGGEWAVYDEASGLPSAVVVRMCLSVERDGSYSVVAGTEKGLFHLKDNAWSALAEGTPVADGHIGDLLETKTADGSSVIWVGGAFGIGRLDRGVWTFYDEGSGLPSRTVRALAEGRASDGSSVVWAGTDEGVAWFDGTAWTALAPEPGLPQVPIRCIAEVESAGGDRALWVGTNGGGLARRANGRWVSYTRETGLPNSQVDTLLQTVAPDGTRTLWIGTNGGGIAYVREGEWLGFGKRSGLPDDEVLAMCETTRPDGSAVQWFGTADHGLVRVEDGKIAVITEANGLPSNRVKSLVGWPQDGGREAVWVGTRAGLALVVDGRVAAVYDTVADLPSAEILSFAVTPQPDGSRTLWVATAGGLARLDGERWTTYTEAPGGMPNGRVQSLLASTGDAGELVLWVGTNGGLARLAGNRWTVYTAVPGGLANNVVLSLLETRSRDGRRLLMAGTFAGLSVLDLSSETASWTTYSDAAPPALPNNNVFRLHEDRAGRIYASTTKGIARLTPRAPTPDDPAEFEVFTFTAEDGMPGAEYNIGSSMLDSRGRVWFGGTKGVAMYDPSREVRDTTPKPLYVERILVGQAERNLAPNESLPHDVGGLVFEYALLSFHRAGDTRFRTQLVGLNELPSEWTTDAKREYPSLPSGDYVFKVWGRDYAGNVAGPVEIAFAVRPAPWRTWWAYGLYFGLAAGLGYGVVRLRVQTLKRRNQVLEAKVRERTVALDAKVSELEVSERKAQESEKRAVEANRAKSVFLANMSHELRTPLNAILGFVQLMERDGRLTRDQRENLGIIARSGEHLLRLINDVLSLSKIEAGQLVLNENTFNLPRLLRGLEEMFRSPARAKRLQLLFEADPELPVYVHGDEGKLRQVLINLLGNAVKFTDTGGIAVRARWREGSCHVEVEDTGCGIAREDLDKLFRAFVQTESGQMAEEGTGLGLAISRSFVRLMGGDLTVRSEPGRGTTFSFHVPLTLAAAVEALRGERRVTGLEPGQNPVRVLVVDDKWENRELLTKLLRSVGLEVREAANGVEAVEVWAEWNPHMIWMDIRMPGMDGLEATRRIRSAELKVLSAESQKPEPESADVPTQHTALSTQHCKIVALTASAFEHDREAVMAAGCDDFLAKPFRESAVFDKMAEHLGLRYLFDGLDPAEARGLDPADSPRPDPSSLPVGLRRRLKEALVQGDVAGAYGLVEGIRERDEALADHLTGLLRAYRFDEVLDLMTRGEG